MPQEGREGGEEQRGVERERERESSQGDDFWVGAPTRRVPPACSRAPRRGLDRGVDASRCEKANPPGGSQGGPAPTAARLRRLRAAPTARVCDVIHFRQYVYSPTVPRDYASRRRMGTSPPQDRADRRTVPTALSPRGEPHDSKAPLMILPPWAIPVRALSVPPCPADCVQRALTVVASTCGGLQSRLH